MTTALVIPGEGTILSIAIATVMTAIAQVHEIEGLGVQVKAIPNANLSSAAMTTRPSHLPTPEKATTKLWFDANDTVGQKTLRDRAKTPGTVDDFKVTFNDGLTTPATATFSGFVTTFKLNGMKNEENVGADCEIQLTTAPVFTAGTP